MNLTVVSREVDQAPEPIRAVVDSYLEWHAELRSPNYTRDNTSVLRVWAREITELGCDSVQEIDTFKLQTWFYQKARSVKISTAAAYVFAVQHFLAWCKDELNLVDHNAAHKVKIPRHSKAVRRVFLSLRDSERLIDGCVDEELRFALFCALHAGLRFGEVVAAKPGWFDLDAKLIHVQISDEWQTKNGKPRTIPMSAEFHTFLEIYGLRAPYMIAGEKLRAERNRYRFDFSRRFERLTMQLGIECCFHDLRRTFASLKVSSGVSIYKVARWCGHRMEIAELHYGHLVPSDDEIEVGIERRAPAPQVEAPELPAHRQLTWEELHALVWEKPLTRAARDLGITDNGLKKMCNRMKIPRPPQGYWTCEPANRARFLIRAYRSHHGTVN
jgi:integrase